MKLQFSTPTFKVLNGNKVTVCTYTCAVMTDAGKTLKKFKVTGKACLAPTDEYDANLGKHLADSRAKEKAYSVVAEELPMGVLKEQEARIKEVQTTIAFYKKMYHLRNAERKHLKTLLD